MSMRKQLYEVDEYGLLVEIHVGDPDDTEYVTIDPPQGLYRARWTGTEWVEDMSQEEIDAIQSAPRPLSPIEQLRLEQAQSSAELVELMLTLIGGAG